MRAKSGITIDETGAFWSNKSDIYFKSLRTLKDTRREEQIRVAIED